MKAIEVQEYGESDVLTVVDRETPEPDAGEVRIEVRAAGFNFADVMQRRGHYHGGPQPPYVPGLEVAGVVDEVGEGAGSSVGDRVVAMVGGGGYAEYAIADSRALLPIPDGLDFEAAAGFPVKFITAHNCLHGWGALQADESVLIHAAAGGVGTAAVQLAREAGAEIYGTASTQEKLDMIASLGCDHPINYEETDFVGAVAETFESEPGDGGAGIDLVLDSVGGDVTERSLETMASGGRMVVFGAASGVPGTLRTDKLLFGGYRILGYHLETAMRNQTELVMEAVSELSKLLSAGVLEVQLDRTFALEEAAAAHDYVEGRESIGTVVLTP